MSDDRQDVGVSGEAMCEVTPINSESGAGRREDAVHNEVIIERARKARKRARRR